MPWRRIFFTITLSLLFFPDASAVTLLDNEELRLDLGAYLRLDAEFLNNTVDLDSRLKDDKDAYLGLDYNLSLDAQLKDSDTELYFKFERNGPTDYDAPLFTHNTLMTSCGVIEDYRNDELLPQLEEFWMDTPFVGATRLKAGLYAYQVGQGFSLNGSYENYGFTIYRESAKSSWRLYYCRPDLVYKNHLGPRIRQEEEQGVKYQHNASNFFSFDAKWEDKGYSINPYVGMLSDYTSSGKRNSIYAAPVDRDLLGTVGISLRFTGEKPFFNFETARNFGRADSSDPAYKDIVHKGYLVYAEAGLDFDRAKPSVQFLVCSGNRVSLDEVAAGATSLNSGANRSFSSYSPLNFNLSDSISSVNADSRPVVATGAGYGLNYGTPRPGTQSSSDFDNLIMPSLGSEFVFNKRLSGFLRGYYLASFARPAATLNGEARYLPKELGYELDWGLDFKLSDNALISLLAGYFIPGKYYRQQRDDASGSLLSPFVRGDGKADNAYQFEIALEFTF